MRIHHLLDSQSQDAMKKIRVLDDEEDVLEFSSHTHSRQHLFLSVAVAEYVLSLVQLVRSLSLHRLSSSKAS